MHKLYIYITIAIPLMVVLAVQLIPETKPVPTIPVETNSVRAEFVSQLLITCRAEMSDVRRSILTDELIRVTDRYFRKLEDKQSFMYLICIESKFDNLRKSKAGAVGYTQVMPKYVQSFSDACGLGKLAKGDETDPLINLQLGACQFATLLTKFEGNVALALAGYNSGPDSNTTKKLGKLDDSGHPETNGYLAKYLVLTEQMHGGVK